MGEGTYDFDVNFFHYPLIKIAFVNLNSFYIYDYDSETNTFTTIIEKEIRRPCEPINDCPNEYHSSTKIKFSHNSSWVLFVRAMSLD